MTKRKPLRKLDPSDPLQGARGLLNCYYAESDLVYWRSSWWKWNSATYIEIDEASIRTEIWDFLDKCDNDDGESFKPTKSKVDNVLDALRSLTHLEGTVDAPRR
jgi:putative DNA primase/helicase